jgi:hypothetical protein
MIHVTQTQLNLLERNLVRAKSAGKEGFCPETAGPNRARGRRRENLPENQLERQVIDLLAAHGFTSTRQHVGVFVPYRVLRQTQSGQLTPEQAARNIVRIGEEGTADWWSARPIIPPGGRPLDGPHPWQAFFWECKAPGKRPTAVQLEWMDRRRQVGILAWWFNQFQAADRPSPACEPQDSHVFEVWFLDYFTRRQHGLEG